MPTTETMRRFIARVEQGFHAEAIEEFYLENASMRENMAEPRDGGTGLPAREGERNAEERFFYDPAQRVSKQPAAPPARLRKKSPPARPLP